MGEVNAGLVLFYLLSCSELLEYKENFKESVMFDRILSLLLSYMQLVISGTFVQVMDTFDAVSELVHSSHVHNSANTNTGE